MPGPARGDATATGEEATAVEHFETHAPARVDPASCGELAAPQRYKVQFTATEEYVRLVQEAKALLSHAAPHASLEEVQLRAMRAFVDALRKRKYGSKNDAAAERGDAASLRNDESNARVRADDEPWQRNRAESPHLSTHAIETPTHASETLTHASETPSEPRQRGRHIPVAVRCAVAARDGDRCTYADASGRRCSETRRLEFHHIVPFALRRLHEPSNLTLRCAAHNALAAEDDFGRERIDERRRATRHERFREQG